MNEQQLKETTQVQGSTEKTLFLSRSKMIQFFFLSEAVYLKTLMRHQSQQYSFDQLRDNSEELLWIRQTSVIEAFESSNFVQRRDACAKECQIVYDSFYINLFLMLNSKLNLISDSNDLKDFFL